jgi:hypothetical protein
MTMIPSCYARKDDREQGIVLRAINAEQKRPIWTLPGSIAGPSSMVSAEACHLGFMKARTDWLSRKPARPRPE